MKHHRLFWFPSLLICVSLACTLGQITGSEGVLPVEIDDLSVSPTHGSGNFTATLKFSQHDVMDDLVNCEVDTGNLVKTIMLGRNDNIRSAEFTFPVTEPGSHSLLCKAPKSGSQKTATFTVDSGSEPQEPSGGQPLIDPSKLIHGELCWVEAPGGFCLPTTYYDDGGGYLRLTADGKIEGYCSWTPPSKRNPDVVYNFKGTLHGTYELDTGAVTFYMDSSVDYRPLIESINTARFDGTGSFTSPTHAEGTATYRWKCQSTGAKNLCKQDSNGNYTATYEGSGTFHWTMDFTP